VATHALLLSREEVPPPVRALMDDLGSGRLDHHVSAEDVEQALDRGIVDVLILDADHAFETTIGLCRRLKADPFHSVIPIVFVSTRREVDEIETAFECGADEFLSGGQTEREQQLRLRMVLERAARDVSVNPTTMLPGVRIIQHEIRRRMDSGETFAVCYADIDSFKEFNDKHSYHRGDRVIRLTSQILRDSVRRLSRDGFVGHVGGDDFIYTLPFDDLERVSTVIIETFDTLMPLQYDVEDRVRGYYFAEDRQGEIRKIPLMSISIGVVTNVRRRFTHPAKVSELSNEMKGYAKTFPGSLFVVDRRHDRPSDLAAQGIDQGEEGGGED